MPIESICQGCGKTLRVADEFLGRTAKCPNCQTLYVVGQTPSASLGSLPSSLNSSSQLSSSSVSSDAASGTEASPYTDSSLNPSSPSAMNKFDGEPDSSPILRPLEEPVTNTSDSNAASESTFVVRTPTGGVYGPASAKTILEWIQQGRLDDSCHIRANESQPWIGIPAWRFQLKRSGNPLVQPASYGSATDQPFGATPVSRNQSAGYSSGNGLLPFILGILSWVLCPSLIGALICAIFAITTGFTELRKVAEGRSPESQRLLAWFGIVLGMLNLGVMFLGVLFFIGMIAFS